MSKFLRRLVCIALVIALAAGLTTVALADGNQTAGPRIYVPESLGGWYVGLYDTNYTIDDLKYAVDWYSEAHHLNAKEWNDAYTEDLLTKTGWQKEGTNRPYGTVQTGAYYAGSYRGTFYAGNTAIDYYVAFLFCDSARITEGTQWKIYIANKMGECVLTDADLYMQGVFGEGTKPLHVAKIVETGAEYTTLQAAVDAVKVNQTVKLLSSVKENITVTAARTLTLDLNGYVINGSGKGSVITNRGKLTVTDSDTASVHYIKYAKSGAWALNAGSGTGAVEPSAITSETAEGTVIKVTGGCIAGGKAASGGGINNSGTLNLSAGTVIGNLATENGGGIYNSGTLYMAGGSIEENTVTGYNGGGIYNGGTLYMAGGTVSRNQSARYGGGISVGGTGNTKLFGGTVTGNKAQWGGGVESGVDSDSPYTLGGSIQITGNTSLDGTTVNNMCFYKGFTVSVADGSSEYTYVDTNGETRNIPAPGDMSVGVNTTTENYTETSFPVSLTKEARADYSGKFISDDTAYGTYNDGISPYRVVKLGIHYHVWNYTLATTATNYDTVVANCVGTVGTCGYTGSDTKLVISAANAPYDTKAHGASLSATGLVGLGTLPAIKYEKKNGDSWDTATETVPKEEGTYRASITVGLATASVTYTIGELTMTVNAPATVTFTYDGMPHEGAATPSETDATVTYSTDGGSSFTDKVPQITDAGELKVIAKATKANYKDAVCSYTLTVKQAEPTLSMPATVEFTYNGSAQGNPCIPSISGAPVVYSVDGGAYTSAVPQLKDAGFVSVRAKIDSPNYKAASCEYVLTVIPCQVTLTGASATKAYDGTALSKQAVSVTEGGFIGSESFDFVCTGSQTEVGCSYNYFTYTLKNGAKVSNYAITCKYGLLTVKSKSDSALQVDVSALRAIAEKLQGDNPDSTVSVYMIVKREVPREDKVTLSPYTKDKQAIYYIANLYAEIDSVTYDIGNDNEILITVSSSLTFEDRENFHVYRVHSGSVDELKVAPNSEGEYFELDTAGNKVLITAKKYSTYAIVYDGKSPKTGDNGNLYIFGGLMLISALGLCAVAISKRKKEEN